MRKRTKALIAFFSAFALLSIIAIAGFLYYRTTPHYILKNEHAVDVTLDNGNVVRFMRHYKASPDGFIYYDELDVYKIIKLCSDELVIPEEVGGYIVTSFGKHTPVAMFMDVDEMQIKRMTLPDTMKEVSPCGQLRSLEYLDIGKSTLEGIQLLEPYNLKELNVSPDNTRYILKDGCLVEKEIGRLVLRFGDAPIDENVLIIGTKAVNEKSSLIIPKSVEILEQGSINLEGENASVFVPVTVKEIETAGVAAATDAKIYCELPQKGDSWNDEWSDVYLNGIGVSEPCIIWNCTLEEYNNLEN